MPLYFQYLKSLQFGGKGNLRRILPTLSKLTTMEALMEILQSSNFFFH